MAVQGVPGALDVSVHDYFGTHHFGTYSIRCIVASGHVISGPGLWSSTGTCTCT